MAEGSLAGSVTWSELWVFLQFPAMQMCYLKMLIRPMLCSSLHQLAEPAVSSWKQCGLQLECEPKTIGILHKGIRATAQGVRKEGNGAKLSLCPAITFKRTFVPFYS